MLRCAWADALQLLYSSSVGGVPDMLLGSVETSGSVLGVIWTGVSGHRRSDESYSAVPLQTEHVELDRRRRCRGAFGGAGKEYSEGTLKGQGNKERREAGLSHPKEAFSADYPKPRHPVTRRLP